MNSYYEKFLATGEVKCIDDEIPFDIPQGWEWARFSAVVNLSPSVSVEDNVDAAFMPMTLINAGYGSEYSYEIKKWNLIKTGFTKIAIGDIAFAKITPCFQNRKSFILGAVPGGVAAATTELNVLRLYGQTLKAWYILYFLKSDYFIQEAKYKGTAGQQRVLSSYVQNKLIPIPSSNEQNRIVKKIQELLPIVDKYEKSQETLDKLNDVIFDKLKKSILQEAIQGKLVSQDPTDEPASVLLQRIHDEKLRLVKEGKLKKKDVVDSIIFRGDDNKYYERIGNDVVEISDVIPFDLPDTWQWVRLGQLASLSIGKTPTRGDAQYWTNVTKNWVSISDMKDYGRITTTKEKISDNAVPLMGASSPIETLLMSFKLTVGRTSILDIEAYHNEAIISIYPYFDNSFVLRNYLFYVLPILANMGDSKDAIKGRTLNSKSLNNLLIPLSSLTVMQCVTERIETLFNIIK